MQRLSIHWHWEVIVDLWTVVIDSRLFIVELSVLY